MSFLAPTLVGWIDPATSETRGYNPDGQHNMQPYDNFKMAYMNGDLLSLTSDCLTTKVH